MLKYKNLPKNPVFFDRSHLIIWFGYLVNEFCNLDIIIKVNIVKYANILYLSLRTNCLSVFDHFIGLALKVLKCK